jgi:hypothetical protein
MVRNSLLCCNRDRVGVDVEAPAKRVLQGGLGAQPPAAGGTKVNSESMRGSHINIHHPCNASACREDHANEIGILTYARRRRRRL